MAESQSARLNRIEEKIDKLSEAMISLARAEEKLVAMEQKYASQYDRLNRFSEKLDSIERTVDKNTHTVMIINRLFWAVTVAVAGSIAAQIFA